MAAVKGKGLMEQVCAVAGKIAAKIVHALFFTKILIILFFHLFQDLTTLDVNTLTPLSPEVISRQATINIGKFLMIIHLLFSISTLLHPLKPKI
jgi:hypothetical protein